MKSSARWGLHSPVTSTMTDQLTMLEDMANRALQNEPDPSGAQIRELLDYLRALPIIIGISDDEIESLAKKLEERINITQHVGSILTQRDHRPWLDAAKSQFEPYFWNRYSRYLIEDGFAREARAALDAVTDRVLGQLNNPTSRGPWDRRGLVVGHVQSGKTANYTGLVCKAADAGFKLIVVIAGIHNNLRAQTQRRLDLGFVGRDSSRLLSSQGDLFLGVGRIDHSRRPVTFTNTIRDFSKNTASAVGISINDLKEPAVFVIKKNHTTLQNLIEWLREHSAIGGTRQIDIPMLLIDDEADNASINIRRNAGEVSRINGQIRQLLRIFTKSCYVGYTATPFANIFIEPSSDDEMIGEDLFPRSFIVSLDPPSNYFGANSVFLESEDSRYIRHIDDNEDHIPIKHTKDFVVGSLPPSLLEAMRAFVIARAVRLSRGHVDQHCSMLVNVSRFIDVQHQLRNLLHDELDRIRRAIRFNFALDGDSGMRDAEMQRLNQVWNREFRDCGVSWEQAREHLHKAAAPIVVSEVNSRSSDPLDYQNHREFGLNVIAIGGFSLSRGLTLEGLMVSYFMRNSMMYDTLMQMGRWFGYRPEYQDLCRIWMPEGAEGWYEHIAESIEELRAELRAMESVNATPEEFGLKVRGHPDSLIVTARNKLGSGSQVVVNIGLSDKLIETHTLLRDEANLSVNRHAARNLVDSLERQGHALDTAACVPFGRLLTGISVDLILDFLAEFRNHGASFITDGDPVRRYIEGRRANELANWDVLFVSTRRKASRPDKSLGFEINCQVRTVGLRSDNRTLRIGEKQRVSSRGIEQAGLTDDQIAAAMKEHLDESRRVGRRIEGTINYPDHAFRKHRIRPLLMIHLIQMRSPDDPVLCSTPIVAWGISFPRTQMQELRVEYVVNAAWLRENFEPDWDEEEIDGDEG